MSYLNARYLNNANGQFISLDPVARDIAMMEKMPAYILVMNQGGGMIDQNTVLSDPQLLNLYSYSKNNPITLSDPSGKYVEIATGVTGFGMSGATGIRIDKGGIDGFVAGGAGAGFGGGLLTVSVNGASLSHKTESVVTYGGAFTTPFLGASYERSGSYEPSTLTAQNMSSQKSLTFGRLGAEAYLRKEGSTPLLRFGAAPTDLSMTNGSNASTPNYTIPSNVLIKNNPSTNTTSNQRPSRSIGAKHNGINSQNIKLP
jgi:hypothetical protein